VDPTLPARLAYQVLSYRQQSIQEDDRAQTDPSVLPPTL
jgi:hypothetical protein